MTFSRFLLVSRHAGRRSDNDAQTPFNLFFFQLDEDVSDFHRRNVVFTHSKWKPLERSIYKTTLECSLIITTLGYFKELVELIKSCREKNSMESK